MSVEKFDQWVEGMWCSDGNPARWRVKLTPEGEKNKEKLPYVDLSRTGHGCMFRLDRVEDHDGHAPSRFTTGTNSRDAYVKRVVNEAKSKLAVIGDNICGFTKKA